MSDTLDQNKEKRNENISHTENRNDQEDTKNTTAKKGNNSKSLRVSQTEP